MKRIGLSILTVLLLAGVCHACPMCKDTIANTSSGSGSTPGLSAGFNYSIYAMFGGFFFCLCLVGHTIYKGVRDTPR